MGSELDIVPGEETPTLGRGEVDPSLGRGEMNPTWGRGEKREGGLKAHTSLVGLEKICSLVHEMSGHHPGYLPSNLKPCIFI